MAITIGPGINIGGGISFSDTGGASSNKAIFGYGLSTYTNITNLVTTAGVVGIDETGVGTARTNLAAAGYGTDKAIFGFGNNEIGRAHV